MWSVQSITLICLQFGCCFLWQKGFIAACMQIKSLMDAMRLVTRDSEKLPHLVQPAATKKKKKICFLLSLSLSLL
jgi:hypothetical protein